MDNKSQKKTKQELFPRRRYRRVPTPTRGHRRRESMHGASSQTHAQAWSAPTQTSESPETVPEETSLNQCRHPYTLPPIRALFPEHFQDTSSTQADTPGEEPTTSHILSPNQALPAITDAGYTTTNPSGAPTTTNWEMALHSTDEQGSRDPAILPLPVPQRGATRGRGGGSLGRRVMLRPVIAGYAIQEVLDPGELEGTNASATAERLLCGRCGTRQAYPSGVSFVYCRGCRMLWAREK
ncbi:hypothetical protein ANO14919_061580 [Xylariales sp. No.14919]|nr:hypothetical protein ANO14919_061580 [Xylariales sp. No.14919]